MKTPLPGVVLFFSVAAAVLAQDAARMDEIVQSYVSKKQFMGSVLVARGDDVLFSRGYGFANLEWEIPNKPDTKFRLGSITKQFTAVAVLLLAERDKLGLDEPIGKHLPDAPAAWEKITFFHLLTHTAGVPSFTSFPEYRKAKMHATTPAELVATFRDKPLEFAPGERMTYSNSGYVLLSHLVEKISGQSYERFLQENIFTPLGMKDSGYDSNAAILPRRASGYSPAPGGPRNAEYVDMTIPQGAGALYSTTEDLLKWERALFGGKLLQPASLEKMITPFKSDYAFGLVVNTAGSRKVIQHGGGIEGFNTELSHYPESGVTVAVLANLNGPFAGQIGRQLAALAHGDEVKLPGERKEITLQREILNRYVGGYALGPGMLITLEGDQLISKLGPMQPPVPIFPESETLFFAKVVDAQIEFPVTAEGAKAAQMILHQNGRDQVARRLDDAAIQRLTDAATAVVQRIKDQVPVTGGEDVLRQSIEGLRTGQPDYESMSRGLATVTRQQLPQLQSRISQLGEIRAITFQRVEPSGADVYEVKFDHGALEYRIWVASDGKLEGAALRPLR